LFVLVSSILYMGLFCFWSRVPDNTQLLCNKDLLTNVKLSYRFAKLKTVADSMPYSGHHLPSTSNHQCMRFRPATQLCRPCVSMHEGSYASLAHPLSQRGGGGEYWQISPYLCLPVQSMPGQWRKLVNERRWSLSACVVRCV